MTQTQEIPTTEEDAILYCTVHPDRETTLRCNKCGRPMCAKCAVQTPVGYRCRECVKGIQDGYYKATQNDYLVIFAVCGVLGLITGAIISAIPLGLLFTFIIALPVGGGIGEIALRLTSRRRGRQSANIAVAATVIGGLLGAVILAYFRFYQPVMAAAAAAAKATGTDFSSDIVSTMFTYVFNDISLLLFVGLAAAAVYGRFKMRS